MPTICERCESQEFQLQDGLYYCTVCGLETQQEIGDRYEEYGDDVDDEHGGEMSSSMISNSQEKPQKGGLVTQDYDIPWVTLEAYQTSLKAHVNVLIELGFSVKLDNIAQQLWFCYLDAYNYLDNWSENESEDTAANHCGEWRFRHHFVNNFKEKGLFLPSANIKHCSRKLLKYKMAKKHNLAKKKRESESEGYTSGVTTDFTTSGGEESDNEDNFDENEFAQHKIMLYYKRKIKSTFLSAHDDNLSLVNIPTICYLSLLYLQQDVTPGDLITMISSGVLPYLSTLKLLPKHMILTFYDIREFSLTRPPSYKQIVIKAHFLSLKLKLHLEDSNVLLLVSRYIHELKLPLTLIEVCKQLYKDVPYSRSNRNEKIVYAQQLETLHLYLPDLMAMALVLVSLKLILQLNDDVEFNDFTHCGKHMNCDIFSYNRWMLTHKKDILHKQSFEFHSLNKTVNPKVVNNVRDAVTHFLNNPASSSGIPPEQGDKKCKKYHLMHSKLSNVYERILEYEDSKPYQNENIFEAKLHLNHNFEYQKTNCRRKCIFPHLQRLQSEGVYSINQSDNGELFKTNISSRLIQDLPNSYKEIINLATTLTCAPPDMIQELVQFVEKHSLSKFLNPNSLHKNDLYWEKFFCFMANI